MARPQIVMTNTVVVVLLVLMAVLVVDIWGGPPTGGWPLWYLLYHDGPVEFVQWSVLAAAILVGAFAAGRCHRDCDAAVVGFLRVMPIGLALMLIEDAGDVRHRIRVLLLPILPDTFLGAPPQYLWELVYLTVLALVPLYAGVAYGRRLLSNRSVRGYLVVGFAGYGAAVGLSVMDGWLGAYAAVGRAMHERFPGTTLVVPERFSEGHWYFLFGDGVLEESIELIAAGAMLATMLALARVVAASEPGER